MKTIIYHNPRCSKSRETLALLKDAGIEPTIVEYLNEPPTVATLREIMASLGLRPREVVRTKETVFATLNLDLDDDEAVLQAIAAHPVLLERPIVLRGGKAAIGRPPENVRKILD